MLLRPRDMRLAVLVTHADGRTTRWGPDEHDPGRILQGLQFGTAIPGGYTSCSFTLLRDPGRDYPDLNLADEIKVYGPGGRTAFEGRVRALPRSPQGIQVEAVGWQAHLKDDPSFREIYVDRDVGRWREAPFNRQVTLLGAGISMGDFSHTVADGFIRIALPVASLPPKTVAELWYIAPAGCRVASLQFAGGSTIPAGWISAFIVADNDDGSSAASLTTVYDGTLKTTTAATPRRHLYHQLYANGTAATPASGNHQWVTKIAVRGDHSVTFRPTASGEPDGVFASDVIADIVSRAAPRLDATGIEPTAFAIPHLAFHDPVTAEDAILTANAFDGFEWGVYDNRVFFYRAPDPGRLTWEAREDEGAALDLEGDVLDSLYNGVFVSYRDAGTGDDRTVGPPTSTADATHSSLADTSPSNPVNAHGYTRRWAKLDLTHPTTQAGAIQLGAVWLAERSLPTRRGSVTLNGTVTHPTEGTVPVWRVRAGDFIRVTDHSDVARRIVQTDYSDDGKTLRADLDQTPHFLDALLERVGVTLVGVV